MKSPLLFVLGTALVGATTGFAQIGLNSLPSRTVGHPKTPQLEQNTLYSFNPNLVEGRELYSPEGIAVDTSLSPPAVYVSDTGNNRVLGWKNATGFANGQPADIVIGQNDFFTTWAEGPTTTPHSPGVGSPLQAGLNSPTGLAVWNGDLYVADMGNNRVLRFPQPFSQTNQFPNLVIGQPSLNTATANFTGLVSAQGISLANSVTANIAFDSSGNLWMTDPGNRRVLEFAAADVATNGGAGLTAIQVLGQPDFISLGAAAGSIQTAAQFATPSGIGFDSLGRLYVTDASASQPVNLSRVMVFVPPFTNGMAASRIMGISAASSLSLSASGSYLMNKPQGVVFFDNGQGIGVVDSGYNRILIFPSFDNWPAVGTQISPQASAVIGQNLDLTAVGANNTPVASTFTLPPSATVFNLPMAAAVAGGELYVVDSNNNRVVVMPLSGTTAGAATRVLGQDRMDTGSINLIEGREFQFVNQDSSGNVHFDAGLAIDSTGSTPHLYVADSANNRVLAFKDLRKVSAGAAADLVIGQPNGQTALCNYPTNNPNLPTASSLCSPIGVAVDSQGNLWVADRSNGRVLRFPAPFAQTGQPVADVVLGQSSFTGPKITNATSATMSAPYGVAVAASGWLAVSDQALHRVLVFQPSGGAFATGQAAAEVIGQPDFVSTASGSGLTSLYSPHHIATDSSDRLYVADSGNNRVEIFDSIDNPEFPASDAIATFSVTGFNVPEGVFVNQVTGELWVADANNGRYARYPAYVSLVTNSATIGTISTPSYALAVAQDQFGALVTADGTSRVALFYPGLTTTNLGNGLARPLAPGVLASAFPLNASVPFGSSTASFGTQVPLPTSLGNIQVQFDGQIAPLFMISPTQINFQVPIASRTSGYADMLVTDVGTGQVYGAGSISMSAVSPAILLDPSTQTGTVRVAAVINHDDGSVNGPNHPVKDGSWIEVYGTGQGFVPNAPADGTPASGLTPTTFRPTVVLNACSVDDVTCTLEPSLNHIYYSGLAPGLVGVWQIDVLVPKNVAPGTLAGLGSSQVSLAIIANSIPSYDYTQYRTVIYVQP